MKSDDRIINIMPKEFRKDDVVIRRAAVIALRKARMYDTKLAIDKDGSVFLCDPDMFEQSLSLEIKE